MFLWAGIPIIKTKLSLYHHGFEEISTIEGDVLPILYFSGEQGHMRHNASLYSGFIGTYCGTLK